MRAFFVAVVTVVASVLSANAQASKPADHASCAPYQGKWAGVSKGTDLSAMDAVIKVIPSMCPVLREKAQSDRAQAAKSLAQAQAAKAEAARAADPCVQARNDWSYVQNASEATIRAYRDGLPEACGVWRRQAEERLSVLEAKRLADAVEAERQRQAAAAETERQRLAAEQQQITAQQVAARITAITAAARATRIEGKWVGEQKGTARNRLITNLCPGAEAFTLANGLLADPKGFGSDPIERVADNTIYLRGKTLRVDGDNLYIYYTEQHVGYTYFRCP